MKQNCSIIFLLIITVSGLNGRTSVKQDEPLKVFYDGGGSLFNYLRTEIDFVSFVRNSAEADVQLQINSQRTGDGGREYTFFFNGFGQFAGMNDTLVTSVPGNVTDKERDDRLIRLVKLGLMFYISKTSYNKYVDIDFEGDYETETEIDNWDNWIFSIGLNSSIEAEESKKEFMWEADIDADRIKEGSKIQIDGNISNEFEEFEQDDGVTKSSKKQRRFGLLYVNSISDHFSAGFFTNAESKTYENIKFGFNVAPAVEYSLFPYRESIRKKLTFLYRVGYLYNNYFEETIFFKTKEDLYNHSLKIDYELNELWGEADFYLQLSNYLHDFKKNRVEFSSRFSFRLTGSFFFNIRASASYINDQLYLPSEEVSLEEILLNQKKLSTQYEYELKFGVRYTFGSIYNSTVNTRF